MELPELWFADFGELLDSQVASPNERPSSRGGRADKFAQSGDHLAAPGGKFCDVLVDTFTWIHVLLLALFYKLCKSIHGSGCSSLHTRLRHPVEIVNRFPQSFLDESMLSR